MIETATSEASAIGDNIRACTFIFVFLEYLRNYGNDIPFLGDTLRHYLTTAI